MEKIETMETIKKLIIDNYQYLKANKIRAANRAIDEYTKKLCQYMYQNHEYKFLYDFLRDEHLAIQSAGAFYLLPFDLFHASCKITKLSYCKDIYIRFSTENTLPLLLKKELHFPIWDDSLNAIRYVEPKEYRKHIIPDSYKH